MQILISHRRSAPTPWRKAFPDGMKVHGPTQPQVAESPVIWLDLSQLKLAERQLWLQQALDHQRPLVVMSPTPSDDEALQILKLGARGYCHSMAAVSQLLQIEQVINHGGFWVGPAFMQRLMGLVASDEGPSTLPADHPYLSLTGREQSVASAVARGASNREIAQSMQIAERTVKAHLSSAFTKLGVRDRVQLALLINSLALQPA